MKNQLKILLVLMLVFLGIYLIVPSISKNKQATPSALIPSFTEKTEVSNNEFSYKGKNGVDALTLLNEKTKTRLADSGLVASINGREANTTKKEFWSFYVNGKMASVGPADYITKDTDLIEWKIETY